MPSTCFELREQLHYLFFPCSPVGSPSWCLFLRYDIAAHPYATVTVLRFNAVVAPYCGKALFWVDATSQGNNCTTCSFRAVLLGRLHGVCFCAMTLLRTLTPPRQCYILTLQLPHTAESAILGGRCKLGEQLHYLFLPCSPVGSPSWCLFLCYDIAAHPYATTTVLCFNAAVAPYCRKVAFWAHAASHGNNCITCSFRAILLGRLHGVCFCAMTLLCTLTPP